MSITYTHTFPNDLHERKFAQSHSKILYTAVENQIFNTQWSCVRFCFVSSCISNVLCLAGLRLTISIFHFTLRDLAARKQVLCSNSVPPGAPNIYLIQSSWTFNDFWGAVLYSALQMDIIVFLSVIQRWKPKSEQFSASAHRHLLCPINSLCYLPLLPDCVYDGPCTFS